MGMTEKQSKRARKTFCLVIKKKASTANVAVLAFMEDALALDSCD